MLEGCQAGVLEGWYTEQVVMGTKRGSYHFALVLRRIVIRRRKEDNRKVIDHSARRNPD